MLALIFQAVFLASLLASCSESYSLSMMESHKLTRRGYLAKALTTAFTSLGPSLVTSVSNAATPAIFTTTNGIKYAVLEPARDKTTPPIGCIVAVEYTGYLRDGTIFDSTHAEGKKNALVFQLGGNAVIEGINEMVSLMGIGEKVQAIIPPQLAFGDKGLCLENGECLIRPKSTLIYDITLKRSAIPPP